MISCNKVVKSLIDGNTGQVVGVFLKLLWGKMVQIIIRFENPVA